MRNMHLQGSTYYRGFEGGEQSSSSDKPAAGLALVAFTEFYTLCRMTIGKNNENLYHVLTTALVAQHDVWVDDDQKRVWLWRRLVTSGSKFPLKHIHTHSHLCFVQLLPCQAPSARSVALCLCTNRSTRAYRMSEHTLHRRYVTATASGAPLAQHKHRVFS